jgi:5-(aminomethyl)-3-furanmethanol phosphate kinase
MPATVIKLGGSGLTFPGGADRVRQWLSTVNPRGCLLFPGGGPAADLVRRWHLDHGLTEETSHWLAIAALGLAARFWAAVLPRTRLVADRDEADRAWRDGQRAILDPEPFLRREEAGLDDAPPHNWDVTSDSLAAWTAQRWPAEELVLVKVPPAPLGQRLTAASQLELIDPYFPGIAGQVPRVGWLSLQLDSPEVVPWLELGVPIRGG